MILFLRKYFIFFLVGCVTALSQAPFDFTVLSLIGFSAFFYFILKQENIHYFFAGHSFGFGYFLVSLCWIGNALLTDITQFAIFLPFAYLGLPLALACFYGVALWLYQKIIHFYIGRNSHYIIHKYILFVILLSGSDYLRGHIFTGFPWNLPVYTTASHIFFMQPSYLVGIYGYNLVWLFFATSFSLYFLKTNHSKHKIFIGQCLCTICILSYSYWHIHYDVSKTNTISTADNIIVRIIQPNITQKLKWSPTEAHKNFETLLNLSTQNLNPDNQYIFIWPETALPFNPEYDKNIALQIAKFLNHKHSLISGKVRFIQNPPHIGGYQTYNSIFKFTPDNKIEAVFDKVHLVPFGEYLPLRFILEKIGFSQVNFFKSSFSAGTGFKPFVLNDTITAGGLICYEAIFPSYSNIIKQNKADVIINLTNDAWFGNSFGPFQHFTQTQFRAVENAIPIIRSANTGISGFIDKNGKIIKSLPLNQAGFIDMPLRDFMPH
jgi:apolipoprotein N-acyltransferase